MNAIVGFSDILSLPGIGQNEIEECIKNINQNSESLLNLIDNIIEVARIESGHIKINKSWIEIDKVIPDLHRECSYLNEEKPDINFTLQKPPENPINKIYTDNSRFKKVIKHLLNNAFKFTTEGSIILGYEFINDKNLRVFVKDTGIGIDKANHKIIFKRFTKIEDENITLYRGTGLGLFLAKRTIESIGGTIHLESEKGKGSCFDITLPLENPTE